MTKKIIKIAILDVDGTICFDPRNSPYADFFKEPKNSNTTNVSNYRLLCAGNVANKMFTNDYDKQIFIKTLQQYNLDPNLAAHLITQNYTDVYIATNRYPAGYLQKKPKSNDFILSGWWKKGASLLGAENHSITNIVLGLRELGFNVPIIATRYDPYDKFNENYLQCNNIEEIFIKVPKDEKTQPISLPFFSKKNSLRQNTDFNKALSLTKIIRYVSNVYQEASKIMLNFFDNNFDIYENVNQIESELNCQKNITFSAYHFPNCFNHADNFPKQKIN